MTFEALRESIKKLNCEIKSDAVAFYFEAVFNEVQRSEIEKNLSCYFSEPLKSADQPPTSESDACSGRFGGAKENQTLYVKKNEGRGADVALIWPWNSGERYTLKLIRG